MIIALPCIDRYIDIALCGSDLVKNKRETCFVAFNNLIAKGIARFREDGSEGLDSASF
jgi:hypothetical protein